MMKCYKTMRSISSLILIVASMTYAGIAPAQVTTFEDCNYKGKKAEVPIGKFTWPNLLRDVANLKDNDISSIKVGNGYKATLYADPNYKGRSVTVTRDIDCLQAEKFNDTMSSIKVEGPATKPLLNTGGAGSNSTAWNSLLGERFSNQVIASNIHFTKCLTANPLKQGFEVDMTPCSTTTLQRWYSGASRIHVQDPELCLEAEVGSDKKVFAAPCKEVKTQNWTLTKTGEIKSGAGYCLNAVQQTDGYKVGKIITYSCTGNENQKWSVQKPKSEIALRLYAHKFDVSEIRSPFNNACMEVDRADQRKGGFNVRTDVKCERIRRPHWSADGETFKNDGLCLQSSGNNVIAKKCDGSFEQSWFTEVDRIGHNVPKLIESPSGKCLQVFPDAKSTYANVALRDCDTRNPAQDWDMVRGQRGLDASDIPTLGPATVLADKTSDIREYEIQFWCRVDESFGSVGNEDTDDNVFLTWYDSRGDMIEKVEYSGLCRDGKKSAHSMSSKFIPRSVSVTTTGTDAALVTHVTTRKEHFLTSSGKPPTYGRCLSKDPDDGGGDWRGHVLGGYKCTETLKFNFSDVAWD